ncbi:MAG TPA: hypothetical protein VN408_14560 [Actinoplanes sp.]|nr:hypothetical protein [Actinoplanes sp.]
MAELNDPGRTGYGDNYVTAAPATPTLAMADGYRDALSLTGENLIGQRPKEASEPDPVPTSPSSSYFEVRPSDIRAVEQTILTELRTQVDGFDTFRRLILNTEGWIFLVERPEQMDEDWRPKPKPTPSGNRDQYAPGLDLSSLHHKPFSDPDTTATQKIIDEQHALLRAVSGAYGLVGHWVAHLNNAAQNYVAADRAAFGTGTPNVEGLDRP